jgi:hypothetical protein
MARKRLGFKPSHKQILSQNEIAMDFMLLSLPPSDPRHQEAQRRQNARLTRIVDAMPVAKRAKPRQLEAPVVSAIADLLAVHPRVLWAARFNSGQASYEAKSGKYAPVAFHRIVRQPTPTRMPDFFGVLSCGLPFAVEAKAPGWTKPKDDREREQMAFLNMIALVGGTALFATSADDVAKALA